MRKTRFIEIGKPKLVEFGPIVDISMGGLAVQYLDNKSRVFESEELAISTTSDDIKVEAIPFKTLSDKEVSRIPGGKTIRNRCVEFGRLSAYQTYQLESFIKQNAAEINRDRRTGDERRQYDDPRFEDDAYREIYEQRMQVERRKSP